MFVFKKRTREDIVSCREFNLNKRKLRIDVRSKHYKSTINLYIHQSGYFHSPYQLKVPQDLFSIGNTYLNLENEVIQELQSSNEDCEDGANFDNCFNDLLIEYMNSSTGCILSNSINPER